jgi:hypothetical protein
MQHPALTGLPIAVFADVAWLIKRVHHSLFRQSRVPWNPQFPSRPHEAERAARDAEIERVPGSR